MIARQLAYLVPLVAALTAASETNKTASELMDAAAADAAAHHKNILVVFHASWCSWCRAFDTMLADKKAGPIMDKYFVTTRVDVLEHAEKAALDTPGGGDLMAKAGGKGAGLPFLAMFDAGGAPIVSSMRPVKGKAAGENIGYPNKPGEIDWFMTMLRRSAPDCSADEAHIVENWLKKHAR